MLRKLIMALVILALFGCTGVSKESRVKCPKCGAVFTVQEGVDWHPDVK